MVEKNKKAKEVENTKESDNSLSQKAILDKEPVKKKEENKDNWG